MKKRLLITSIVMMLVVAVALSTATYAWFTSNASVTASTITLTAESNTGAALGIGWVGGDTGTSITAINPDDTQPVTKYNPMVPSALVVDTGSNTPTNFSAVTWSGATTRTVGGNPVFNEPYASVAPYQYSGTVSSSTVDTFYIENLSASNPIASITMSLEDVTDASDLLRVAVFTSSTSNGAYTLKAVLAKTDGADTEFGVVEEDGNVADLCTTPVDATTTYTITNLAAQGKVFFKVVAWLDGVVLDDTTAEGSATVSLKFQA